jgi:hypothetical protein
MKTKKLNSLQAVILHNKYEKPRATPKEPGLHTLNSNSVETHRPRNTDHLLVTFPKPPESPPNSTHLQSIRGISFRI